MVDAVDKLMSELRSACVKEQIVRSHHVIYAQEAIATLRAELEQVKRDNANLKDLLDDARSGAAKLLADRIRSVVTDTMVEAATKQLGFGPADHTRIRAALKAALAEPAEDAECLSKAEAPKFRIEGCTFRGANADGSPFFVFHSDEYGLLHHLKEINLIGAEIRGACYAEPAGEFDRIVSDSSEFVASLSDSMRVTGRSVFNTAEPAGGVEVSELYDWFAKDE